MKQLENSVLPFDGPWKYSSRFQNPKFSENYDPQQKLYFSEDFSMGHKFFTRIYEVF